MKPIAAAPPDAGGATEAGPPAADGALKALEARRLAEAARDAPKPGDAP